MLVYLNRHDEAIAEMERALEIDPSNELFRSLAGIVLVAARRYDDAIELFQKAKPTSPGSAIIHRGLHTALHMKDRVLDLLDIALEKRDADLPYVGWGFPHLDLVREDPRFEAILRQVNLPLA